MTDACKESGAFVPQQDDGVAAKLSKHIHQLNNSLFLATGYFEELKEILSRVSAADGAVGRPGDQGLQGGQCVPGERMAGDGLLNKRLEPTAPSLIEVFELLGNGLSRASKDLKLLNICVKEEIQQARARGVQGI